MGEKKATAYLSRELSKARYNSSTGGKKEKNNVNKLRKDDERTAKEATNTNHRLTQPCLVKQQELHMCKQSIRHVSTTKYL